MRNQTKKSKSSLRGEVVGYVDNNPNKPIYQATKDIKVKLVDWDRIVLWLKSIDESLQNDEWDIENRGNEGIISVGGKSILIDNECCGIETEIKNVLVSNNLHSGNFVEISFWKKYPSGSSMFPSFSVQFDLSDIEKYVTGEQELWEFMGSRYDYNPRISNNLDNILKINANEN